MNGQKDRSAMDSFFSPASVAVIGATDRAASVGRTVLANLMGAKGPAAVYPVNAKYQELLGCPCFPSIGKVPGPVDLAVIVTPALTVPGVVRECVSAGVKAIVVISAGFKERGAEGAALERQIQAELRGTRVRVIGPNCLGLMSPWTRLNATFAQDIALPGNVAFLSQSGALLTAVLDWSLTEKVGFSTIVSTGSMLDVGWGDLISYFGDDPRTKSILIYMESIGDSRAFLSAAREVSFSKPIIVLKAGRSQAAAHAAASHTGALTGADEVYDAAFRRCGVLRVQTIAEIFHMAELLGKQPLPQGPRLMILTNAGGPGVLATDALIASGGELAELSDDSRQAFNDLLPPHWSHANPVDILGDADPERYARAIEIAMQDKNSDGLLAVLAPQGMTDPEQVALRLGACAKGHGKPLLASWMGGDGVAKGVAALNSAGIPTFAYPDSAAHAFEEMWRYSDNLRALYETPIAAHDPEGPVGRMEATRARFEQVARAGRTLLTEIESKEILRLYGIPTVPMHLAKTAEEAAACAAKTGFPVVLKLHSEIVTHKTEVDGVKLNLADPEAVRRAFTEIEASVVARKGKEAFLGVSVQPMVRQQGYELILGSSVDPQFGPVLLFGSGGQLVEVYRDRALGLPPLNTTLARRLMEQTKVYKALRGIRGRSAVDMNALESLVDRFSQLVVEQPRIREIDINPLLASPEGIVALDARIVLFAADIPDAQLLRPAIRPYPVEYVSQRQLKDGTRVTVRPIRPEDEPLLVAFHEALSDDSVYLRYFRVEKLESRIAHERLIRRCCVDYDREMALVVERQPQTSERREILGVARLTRGRQRDEADLSVLVADHCQRAGVATQLLQCLLEIARREGILHITAEILSQNQPMLALARHFGFRLGREDASSMRTAELLLGSPVS